MVRTKVFAKAHQPAGLPPMASNDEKGMNTMRSKKPRSAFAKPSDFAVKQLKEKLESVASTTAQIHQDVQLALKDLAEKQQAWDKSA